MSKRRQHEQNWYELPFEQRKALMAGHGRVGRQYHGKVTQLITGSTGLDDAEWGVTLFAHDTFYIKDIVYKMRLKQNKNECMNVYFMNYYYNMKTPCMNSRHRSTCILFRR